MGPQGPYVRPQNNNDKKQPGEHKSTREREGGREGGREGVRETEKKKMKK